jgi:hypothetical protein
MGQFALLWRMRSEWISLSASTLVIGAMALVFGTVLNPGQSGDTAADTLMVVSEQGSRWLAMSVMYTLASITLVFGMPAVVSLFEQRRGRRLGLTAALVFTIGAIGTCGFAMLLVFFRAMVIVGAIRGAAINDVSDDRGLAIFLFGWIACFYLGVLLLAIALLVARTVDRWVPVLLLVFVLMFFVVNQLGRIGSAIQVLLLAVAFTGVAMAAVQRASKRTAQMDDALMWGAG